MTDKKQTRSVPTDAELRDFVATVPMRAYRTRTGNHAHLSVGLPGVTRTLCGTGNVTGKPLSSSEVSMAGAQDGRITLCLSCALQVRIAKKECGA